MKILGKSAPWALGVALLAVLLGVFWLARRPPEVKKAQTVAVVRQDVALTVSANGIVQPERSVNVSPKTPGLLKQLRVKEGDLVRQGQILALMDDSNLRGALTQARGQLAAAQANLQRLQAGNRPQDIAQTAARLRDAEFGLRLSQENFQRNQRLATLGAISTLALDSARTERDRAQAQVQVARQALDLARVGARREDIAQAQAQVLQAQGVVESAQTQVNDTVIRAPFTGIITRKFADPGAFVAPTTAGSAVSSATSSSIMALAGTNQIVANVAEANISQIRLGQSVDIQPDAFPREQFKGKVIQVAPQSVVVQNVTSFEVKVALPAVTPLRSGMNADLEFQVGRLQQALMVPTVAIVRQEQKTGVYVQAGEEPRFVTITTGATVDTRTQVLTGLQAGQQVYISFPEGFRPQTNIPGIR
ncbi:efflux RND transporter periplasmic adaptor subunit [Candidatus Cyanaurora vandensis]|uniref:efflux RND transporter periplasmic adaptor subunit n=1 Tax=Candidatus Cyanaurora vandensis TaxID=2714958 RepID=UPI00257D7E1F|nr:biotin/lipoyl-binding protein [Candidatus Cyanaurora vandensis]